MPPSAREAKRKLSTPSLSTSLLQPGSWRGKRSRTNSRSASPSDLGTYSQDSASASSSNHTQPTTHSISLSSDGGPRPLTPEASANHLGGATSTTPSVARGPSVAPVRPILNPDGGEASWKALEMALSALRISTKICPPLHSAVDNLKSCLHIFQEAAKSRKDYKELATGLTAMVELLVKHMSNASSKEIMEIIASIAKNITQELESLEGSQFHSGRRPSRMLGVLRDEEDLVRRYRKIEQLFRQLQAEASMSMWDVTKRHHVNTQLENLGPAKLAIYNSKISMNIGRRSCTENTRTQILSDSMAWAENPNGAKIYWTNGMAGTGKTTIAFSLCERLDAAGKLAASFFCTRTSRECSEAKHIVPTIAYQLARRSAPFRDALCGILDKDPDIGILNTTSQFNSLLAKPLLESKELMERNMVVVIDALDECGDPHTVKIVLDILFRYAADLPVKFFVTSRPEPSIRTSMMAGIDEQSRSRSILYLHEIEKSLVQADIEIYLKDELKHMLPAHEADIEELAEQAGNLFIYAATSVRYICPSGKSVNSKQRLKTILEVNNKSKKSMSDIDVLYSAILSAAVDDDELEPEEQDSIKAVLWTTICACEPVLIDTLAILCGLEELELAVSALQPLRSVLHVSDHNNFVTTLHASFPDFMLSQERSKQFFCDKVSHNGLLAKRCLDIMRAQLRFNICHLKSSFILDDEVPNLKEQIGTHISQELSYACRFWVDHLIQGATSEPLVEMIHGFLLQRLLYWMEVLNLNKCMVIAAVASTKLHMWLRNSQASSNIVGLAHDAQTFVGNYAANQVSGSTPHIYLSALPLSAPTSHIRLTYQPKFTGLVRVTGTLMDQVGQAPLNIWSSYNRIRSASFSADRKYIITGDDSGRISVRHPHSGEPLVTFKAHQKVISSVAFSNDARLVVSGSHDNTLCIWNASNGSLVSGPFKGHTKWVNFAAFSPDGMRLVSGSEDCTVRTWSIDCCSRCQSLLMGHTAAVNSGVFSPDGTLIVSGSDDYTVRIWNALKGVLLFSLQGHTRLVSCVRFSPCGNFIFSGSNDCTIRIWNTHDGTSIGNPFQGHSDRITSLAVSPEGERIASGSQDQTVRVWHKGSGELIAGPFEGHTESVRSVEFSADGARIISASDDKTVRVWGAQGRTLPHTTNKTESLESSLELTAVSHDGAYIASAHVGGTICVWNVADGAVLMTPPETEDILLLTFSPDNMGIFVVLQGGLMRIYNVRTAEPIGSLHRFSSHSKVSSQPLAVSPSGRRAISCHTDNYYELDLWNLRSNGLACRIRCHHGTKPFAEAVFSSDGIRLATGTTDGTLELWDGQSGEQIAGPFRPTTLGLLRNMDLSPDGTQLISVLHNQSPCLYDTHHKTHTILHGIRCAGGGKFNCVKFSSDARCVGILTLGGRSWRSLVFNKVGADWGYSDYKTRIIGEFSFNGATFGLISDEPFLVTAVQGRMGRIVVRTGAFINNSSYTSAPSESQDGWLRDDSSKIVIWVPPEIRPWFPGPNEHNLTERGTIKVGWDGILIGEEWSKCYIGE